MPKFIFFIFTIVLSVLVFPIKSQNQKNIFLKTMLTEIKQNNSKFTRKRNKVMTTIDLSDGKWKEVNFENFQKEKELKTQKLLLHRNSSPLIPSIIVKTLLPELRTLELNQNRITSVQILCSSYFPKLQHLQLRYNQINSLKILRRLNAPKLKAIFLMHNKIIQMGQLSECNFPQIISIWLTDSHNQNQKIIDFKQLLKLATYNLSTLRYQSRNSESLEKQLESKLKQKFLKLS